MDSNIWSLFEKICVVAVVKCKFNDYLSLCWRWIASISCSAVQRACFRSFFDGIVKLAISRRGWAPNISRQEVWPSPFIAFFIAVISERIVWVVVAWDIHSLFFGKSLVSRHFWIEPRELQLSTPESLVWISKEWQLLQTVGVVKIDPWSLFTILREPGKVEDQQIMKASQTSSIISPCKEHAT